MFLLWLFIQKQQEKREIEKKTWNEKEKKI